MKKLLILLTVLITLASCTNNPGKYQVQVLEVNETTLKVKIKDRSQSNLIFFVKRNKSLSVEKGEILLVHRKNLKTYDNE